jgi:hypothetical protein
MPEHFLGVHFYRYPSTRTLTAPDQPDLVPPRLHHPFPMSEVWADRIAAVPLLVVPACVRASGVELRKRAGITDTSDDWSSAYTALLESPDVHAISRDTAAPSKLSWAIAGDRTDEATGLALCSGRLRHPCRLRWIVRLDQVLRYLEQGEATIPSLLLDLFAALGPSPQEHLLPIAEVQGIVSVVIAEALPSSN